MLKLAERQRHNEMIQYLRTLLKRSNNNDFEMLQSLFDYENGFGNASQREVERKKENLIKLENMCNLFINYCNRCNSSEFVTVLTGACNTIIGLIKDKQPINDSILLLCWKFAVSRKDATLIHSIMTVLKETPYLLKI